MENKDNTAYLRLMMDSFRKIREYIGEMSLEEFLKDSKTQSSVIMQLQVVGELAKKVSEKYQKDVNIPWKQIIGMRDTISHDYFSLDLKSVWDTIVKSVPEAEQEVGKYLENI